MDDSGTQCEDDFEKETGESASKPAAVDSKAPETVVVNKASLDDGVSSPTVVEGDTTGGKSKGVDEADSAAILDELIEDEVEPEVSLRDSGIGLEPQPPSPTSEEPKSQVSEAEGSGIVEDKPTPAEPAPLDSQPDTSAEKPRASNDDTKPPTSDTTEDPPSNKEPPTQPDLQSENDGLKQQLKSLRGDYEEKVGILELQLDEEKEKVEEQARRIKELQKLLRKQQDDDMASHGSGDIKEKAKAAASLRLERDFLVRQYSEGKTTEECLRQTITDMLEEKEKDEQKIKDLDARLKRATKDHEAKDKRMDQLQAELRDVTALVTQLEEHMDKVKVEEARRNIQASKARTEPESPVTNNNKSTVCTIF